MYRYLHVYAYKYTRTYALIGVRYSLVSGVGPYAMYAEVYSYRHVLYIFTKHIHASVHISIFLYMYIYIYAHVYSHIYLYLYLYIYIYIYVHIYMHICTHVHVYTHIHNYIYGSNYLLHVYIYIN